MKSQPYNRRSAPQQPVTFLLTPGDTTMKYVNIVMSLFLIIAGGVAIGVGSWLALWTNQISDLEVFAGTDIYVSAYVLLIIAGVLLIVICLVGCCGANQENNTMLLAYVIVLIISLLIMLVVGVLGFVFDQQLQTIISGNYTTAVVKYYGVNLSNTRHKDITEAIDRLQSTFECCGVTGNSNSSNSWYIYQSQSIWHQLNYGGTTPPLVPASCCKKQAGSANTYLDLDQCQGSKPYSAATSGKVAPISPPPVTVANSYLFQTGCITAMTTRVNSFATLLGGVGIALMIFLIICCIVACLLVKAVEDGRYVHKQNSLSKTRTTPVSNESKKSLYAIPPGSTEEPSTSSARPISVRDNSFKSRHPENSPALTRSTGMNSDEEFDA